MKTSSPPTQNNSFPDETSEEEVFHRYTAQEAAQFRSTHPQVSPWRVVLWMLIASVLIGLAAWLVWGKTSGLSALYGSLAVALPAAVMARGMTSGLSSQSATTGASAFLLWEMVKLGLSVCMLALAPKLVANLNWLALLVGLILTLKIYFVAALYSTKRMARTQAS